PTERTASEKSNSTEHGPGNNSGFGAGSTLEVAVSLPLLPFLLAAFPFVTGGGGSVPQVTVPRRNTRTDDASGNLMLRFVDFTVSARALISASPLTNLTWSFLTGDASTKKSPFPLPDASSLRVRIATNSVRPFSIRLSRSPLTPSAANRVRASSLGECPASDST